MESDTISQQLLYNLTVKPSEIGLFSIAHWPIELKSSLDPNGYLSKYILDRKIQVRQTQRNIKILKRTDRRINRQEYNWNHL